MADNKHESIHYIKVATDIVAGWLEQYNEYEISLERLFPSYGGEHSHQNASNVTLARVCLEANRRHMSARALVRAVYEVIRLCEGMEDEFGDIESDLRLYRSVGTHNPAHGCHVG